MAAQQPPARSWFRLASLARMEAAEAAAAAATAGTTATLPRPTTPPFSRTSIIRPQQPTKQLTQQLTPLDQQPIPALQQQKQPQELPPLEQQTPLQQPPPSQQPPAKKQPPMQQTNLLQEATPLLQQPTIMQQVTQPPLLQQSTSPQQPVLPQQPTLPLLLEEPTPPMQPALSMITSSLQRPKSPQQAAQPQQPAMPLSSPPPRSPTPPPQAEPQPAFRITSPFQTEIQTKIPARSEAKQPPYDPQEPPPSPRITTPPNFSNVIRTLYTQPPAPTTEQPKTAPIQSLVSNADVVPKTKALPPPHSQSLSVAPEEKTIPRVQPPPYPEPEPETKIPQNQLLNAFSVASEKKMSANDNGRMQNTVFHDKLHCPSTDSKDDLRLKVITMTGENTGAIMELDSAHSYRRIRRPAETKVQEEENSHGRTVEKEYTIKDKGKDRAAKKKHLTAVANSNVQGINNSIVFNSSCTQLNAGVHITFATNRHPKATTGSSSRLHHH